MKNNPRVDIYLDKIVNNTKEIIKKCAKKEIEVIGITKGCSGDEQVAKAMIEGGIKTLGDSRIENIKKLKESGIKSEMMLIRIPMQSEIKKMIKYVDISLNSELSTIEKISNLAQEMNIEHKIILMIDMGDLREGIIPEEATNIVRKIIKLPHIKLMGIGANFCCVSGVMPTAENLGRLVMLAKEIEEKLKINIKIISGGSTSVLKLVEDNLIPPHINQLRIGIGILLGQDDVRLQNLKGTYQDTFILTAEIVELKLKPSLPIGTIGRDAFGQVPVFKDLGLRKRAILAIGKQDIHLNSLIPLKKGIEIIAASSDHLLIDVTDFTEKKEIGDEIQFKLNYPALLAVTTSKYVKRYYHREEKK
ncbi:MAG: alanine/ornithine racemase family PLP-dependent enzyme [Candidatus Atribacteria bacterium]|nr:alanine/ornithine racemase family PLP-dependent enzyme [Candidatus Atribacteria bacterium]